MATSRVAQQQAPPAEDTASKASGAADPRHLSLPELIRIMDVATTLRKEQEVVEQQLNLQEMKVRLRERLLEAAREAGDPVTAEQVDAAIENYYDKLHSFEEPGWSFSVMMAHLYVRRHKILALALGLAAAWFFFASLLVAGGPLWPWQSLELAANQPLTWWEPTVS